MKHLKTYENFKLPTKLSIFHNYSNTDKTKTGTWGSDDENEYSHLGNLYKTFSFDVRDKVLVIDARTFDPVVSEALFYKISSDDDKRFNSNMEDLQDIHMDYIVNIYLKKNDYAGIIYETENSLIAVDLRDFTIGELERNLEDFKNSLRRN